MSAVRRRGSLSGVRQSPFSPLSHHLRACRVRRTTGCKWNQQREMTSLSSIRSASFGLIMIHHSRFLIPFVCRTLTSRKSLSCTATSLLHVHLNGSNQLPAAHLPSSLQRLLRVQAVPHTAQDRGGVPAAPRERTTSEEPPQEGYQQSLFYFALHPSRSFLS